MNECVFVEFIAQGEDIYRLIEKIDQLGNDFIPINKDHHLYHDITIGGWSRISGSMSSAYALCIKLKDPFLAERMRISYIPDDVKDEYRK